MKIFNLLLLFVCIHVALSAQLTLSVNMSFEPDPDVLNWAAHPETVQLTVTNTSDQTLEYKYLGRLTHNGQLVLDNDPTKMPTETIGPFETRISFAEDIFPSDAVEIHGNSAETYLKTNTIPGGQYLICIKLISLTGQDLSPDNCKPFQITRYTQPSLIFPVATSPVTSVVRPIFSWSPVVPMPAFPVEYRLRVVEVPENTRSWVTTDEPGYYSSKWGSKEWMPKLQAIQEAGGSITEYEEAVGVEILYREDRVVTGVWFGKRTGVRDAHDKFASEAQSNQLSTEAMRALNYGFPLIDIEVGNQTQYQWPMDMPDPLAGRSYVWSVQAFRSDNGLPIGDNEGLSQPAQFFVTEENANADNQSDGAKAPDIIIADENGCLYGCTGNVWEPIDCPTERSFSSSDTYPFTFLLTSTEEGSEKKWFLVDETTKEEPITTGPMLPTSRFTLANTAVNSSIRSATAPGYLDPKTAIITGGGGVKLCWTPQGCVIVEGDEPCPDITWNYLINVVTTPSIAQTTKRANKQVEVTLEQIQPYLAELVLVKSPIYLSLIQDGKLTRVESTDKCSGDYCLTLTAVKNTAQKDDSEVEPSLRRLICWLDENPNGMFPIIQCFDFCTLPYEHNTLTPMVVEDVCIKFKNMLLPDMEDGSIIILLADGSTKCFRTDGTIDACGILPSKEEVTKSLEEANAKLKKAVTFPNVNRQDFYLHDIYSDSNFIKFSPTSGQGANAEKEIKYASADLSYKDWSVIFRPDNLEEEQWEVSESDAARVQYCPTVKCCSRDIPKQCWTVSCYSKCEQDCCNLFADFIYKLNINDTHDHPAAFDPACPKCQKIKFDQGANDDSVQMGKVKPEKKRVVTDDKQSKATLDFIKGKP